MEKATPAVTQDIERLFSFTATPDFYRLGTVTKNNISDQLAKQLSHLQAMLHMTYAEQGETFRMMNNTLQDNFMWGCAGLVDECVALFEIHNRVEEMNP